MAYLPDKIPNANVLITVKTYPLPSSSHGEVVCTAGLLDGKNWVRMYPISYNMYDERRYPKYSWVQLNLIKHPADSRPESFMPRNGLDEPMRFVERIGTADHWAARKTYVDKEVFTSMEHLISLTRTQDKSLATLRPLKIVDFIVKNDEREWNAKSQASLRQLRMFDPTERGGSEPRRLIKKVPFIFKYKFFSEGDSRPREMSIHDWEIGTLYWKCLRHADGDEKAAKALVRKKYFDEFLAKKEVLLFLGTTYEYHKRRVENPFIIIGVFYPPRTDQLSLLPAEREGT